MTQEITIISQHFYPSLSATGQLITDLAKGLAQRGYIVNVFTASELNTSTPNFFNNIQINRTKSLTKHSSSIFSKIISSIFFMLEAWLYIMFRQPSNIPILIVSNPPYVGILGIGFKLFKSGKYYLLLQDIFPESAVMAGIIQSNGMLFRFFNRVIYLSCKYTENTIVLNNAMQSYLKQKYPDLKEQIEVIENWSLENITPCDKQSNLFAQQYNMTQMFTVLYSGNLGRLHDIETIAASAKILRDIPILFVFIGDGAKIKILEDAIETHQLKNILLLPVQPRELLSLSLTACDVSIVSLMPNAESIVAPSKLYGMLAAGRAIIAISSPNSYIDQLLTTSACGINIPPNNSQQLASLLLQLSHEPQKVKAMGERARQLYEARYTFNRALNQYEQLLTAQEIL
jgi:glycosyltransferase involved in cell wall biosynthesis